MTTGQPISLTELTSQKTTVDVTAINENNVDITSTLTGVTAVSDNAAVIVTQGDGPLAFDLSGVVGQPGTANVTFSDPAGDIAVATVTTSDTAVPTVTLVLTARPAVAQ